MDRNIQKEFYNLFPNGSENVDTIPANVKSPLRTNLSEIMNSPVQPNVSQLTYGHWSNQDKQLVAEALNNPTMVENYRYAPVTKQEIKSAYRKIILAIIISCLGSFLFSALAYTFTDSMFSKLGYDFFTDDGMPKYSIIAIHTILFFLLIWLILVIGSN
jgi:hypothetical protein